MNMNDFVYEYVANLLRNNVRNENKVQNFTKQLDINTKFNLMNMRRKMWLLEEF